jgi:hypothetical protein
MTEHIPPESDDDGRQTDSEAAERRQSDSQHGVGPQHVDQSKLKSGPRMPVGDRNVLIAAHGILLRMVILHSSARVLRR